MSLDKMSKGISLVERFLKLLNGFRDFFNGNKDKEDSEIYYFSELNKKVFVSKNGDGVIVCSFDFIAPDPSIIEAFERQLDIEDAKKSTKFPQFSQMCSNDEKNIFKDYKFWYRCDNNIITNVEEYYNGENKRSEKDNDRFLGVRFLVDIGRIEANRKYKVVYGYSIPGLYPILNGKFDEDEKPYKDYDYFSSSISVQHLSEKVKFAVYFEDGVSLSKTPVYFAKLLGSKGGKLREHPCKYRDNLWYHKYCFEIKNPEKYRIIGIRWNVHH